MTKRFRKKTEYSLELSSQSFTDIQYTNETSCSIPVFMTIKQSDSITQRGSVMRVLLLFVQNNKTFFTPPKSFCQIQQGETCCLVEVELYSQFCLQKSQRFCSQQSVRSPPSQLLFEVPRIACPTNVAWRPKPTAVKGSISALVW